VGQKNHTQSNRGCGGRPGEKKKGGKAEKKGGLMGPQSLETRKKQIFGLKEVKKRKKKKSPDQEADKLKGERNIVRVECSRG